MTQSHCTVAGNDSLLPLEGSGNLGFVDPVFGASLRLLTPTERAESEASAPLQRSGSPGAANVRSKLLGIQAVLSVARTE